MYKQKSWNIENLHMGVIKAFIFVSMLFVCMVSMKMNVKAEGFKYVISNAGTHHIVINDIYNPKITDHIFEFDNTSYYYFWAISGNSAYLYCYSFIDNTISKTIPDYQWSVFNTYPDGTTSYQEPQTQNGYWLATFWFDNLISTTFNVFDSTESARSYIENGDKSGLIVDCNDIRNIEPTFDFGEIYDSTYQFIGFDCGELYGATWKGVTNRSFVTDTEDVTEKVQVRVVYEKDGYHYLTLALVDTSELRWAELKESVYEKCDGALRYLQFTPFYYTADNTIYYGKSVQYAISASHGGAEHAHGDTDDGSIYISSGFNPNDENVLGYLQGVKRQLVYEIGFTGYVLTWDTSNSELNDCRVEVVIRFKQQKIIGETLYRTVPYIEYENAESYTTGFYKFNHMDLIKYYKDTYYNSDFSIGCDVDKIFLRLVRYDAVNDSYVYGGFVSIDPNTINSDGINTTDLQNGGTDKVDTDSEDAYSDTTGGIFGSNDIFTRDSVGTSVTNIISNLESTQQFLGNGSFDAFLKSSFSFIPSEIWTIILSGIAVIVGFLFIKLILKVL